MNYQYRGECGFPISTPKPEVLTTEELPIERAATTEQPDESKDAITLINVIFNETMTTEAYQEGTLATEIIGTIIATEEIEGTPFNVSSTDEIGYTVVFETEEIGTLATTLIDGTPLPEEEEEGTPYPEETPHPLEEGTQSPEEDATTIIYEEDATEAEETLAPEDLEGTPYPEEETTPVEYETETVPLEEETDAMKTMEIDLEETGTPMMEELATEEEGTLSPEDLEGTLAPEDLEGTTMLDKLTTAAVDEEEIPEVVELLQQCLDQYQNCFDEVPSTSDATEIIGFFFVCMEEFQTCLAEDPSIGIQGPDQAPELGPS